MTGLAIVALLLLVALNGLFVAAEFALVRSRRSRLEAHQRAEGRGGQPAQGQHLEDRGALADRDRRLRSTAQELTRQVQNKGVPMTIIDYGIGTYPARRAKIRGDDVAISFEGEDTTYARFAGRVTRLANSLKDLGVSPGDRVAYAGFNHPALLETFFATTLVGAACNPAECT